MSEEQTETVREAMQVLENIPCGGIGSDGPTLEELDEYVNETGNPWCGDSNYDTAQRAWRLLERALES